MSIREWVRPPRHLLLVFLAVALISGGTLAWLGLQLVRQDTALEAQRRRERLEQTADRVVAVMQQSLSALDVPLNGGAVTSEAVPADVSLIVVEGTHVRVAAGDRLLFVPVRAGQSSERRELFEEGERLEFAVRDLRSARQEYLRYADSSDGSVRAGALVRLARVARKFRDTAGALRAYDALERIDDRAGDLPAGLVAAVGRASIWAETGRTDDLVKASATLRRDLQSGRWPLTRAQYEFYTRQATEWSGSAADEDPDALARAGAIDWLWQNRSMLPATSRRVLVIDRVPAYVAWRVSANGLSAVAAGPHLIGRLCQTAPSDSECSALDSEGHVLVGRHPAGPSVALRTASSTGLPWTLQIADVSQLPLRSPRRSLLIAVFVVVLFVLAAGWYFIVRAIARESRVSRLQSDFVAAVSHEFRSPLTSLSHVAEMLANNRFSSEVMRRKSYDVLLRDTERLRRLVEALLEFGRMEAGNAGLRLEPLEIGAVVRSVITEFEGRAAAESFHIDLAINMPETLVPVDREAFGRALSNLLDNAIKYSPECRTVWVRVECDADRRVLVVVRDRGLGIPASEQREIFTRFVRGAAPKSLRIKGTGIGLAMVRDIVRCHGGAVRLESAPGQGSAFTMVLPPATPHAESERSPTAVDQRAQLEALEFGLPQEAPQEACRTAATPTQVGG